MRQVHDEYVAAQKGKVKLAETFCGRKRTVKVKVGKPQATIMAGTVNCQSCIKALAALASR